MGLGNFLVVNNAQAPKQYASYNVLARKALIAGVPIISLLIMLMLILVTSVLGVMWFGLAKAFIIPILLGLLLFGIRIKCMEDSRAMEDVLWDAKGAMSRVVCRSNVTSFTSYHTCPKARRAQINDFFNH